MTTLAIIFWTLTGISLIVAFILLILHIYDIVDYPTTGVSFIVFLILCLITICFTVQAEQSKKPKVKECPLTKEYPLTEWRMDYKITTMNEKSDTTLVLTKIK